MPTTDDHSDEPPSTTSDSAETQSESPSYPESTLSRDQIRAHYQQIRPVIDALASVDGHYTLGNTDFVGWYVKRKATDPAVLEAGYPEEGRCATLAHDYGVLVDRIERVLYATTSYNRALALAEWVPCRLVEDDAGQVRTEWQGPKPTPGYTATGAMMAWGDIDLRDELKARRHDLATETRQTVERALAGYIMEFADLYGSREPVFVLDSVGGAYVMGAPAVTLPIAEHFADDRDALAWVMEAVIRRSNEWLQAAQERVEARVDGAEEVLDPDWVNNVNRPYKAPLSIHGDHDAVVTPLSIAEPAYTMTPVAAVDEALIEGSAYWAADLTDVAHRAHVANLVESLWPRYVETNDAWQAALEEWVADQRANETLRRIHRQQTRERRQARQADLADDLPITPHKDDVIAAIDRLDIEAVAEATIVHEWTDQAAGKTSHAGADKRDFIPIWGPSAKGTANYVDLDRDIWVDTGTDDHGTAVEMALIAEEDWPCGKIATGEDWARGVDYLRELGFSIPLWTPDATALDPQGNEYEKMPYWSLRKAAVALDVLPEDAFIEKEGQYGSYLGFPGRVTYNRALKAIEDVGLKHGREYLSGDDEEKPLHTEEESASGELQSDTDF